VLHLDGKPYDIGYEQGTLAASEISDAMTSVAMSFAAEHAGYDWQWLRNTAETVSWPQVEDQYKQEIEGIADGMRAKGFSRDWKDVLALNDHIELGDYYLPLYGKKTSGRVVSEAPSACSAFVATGSETADGKPVVGQNFWWDYFTGFRWRFMLDIRPLQGHRVVFDTLPGMIHSGTDWALNDSGILITETTISDFVGYKPDGIPEFVRMRKAAQYGSSLDEAKQILMDGNNGGYANTWLMADYKSGEIGKLELGLKNVIYHHTNDGYYVGSNFPEDPKLMAEETPDYRPTADNNCEMRRKRWTAHLEGDKGKVNADYAKTYVEDDFDEMDGKLDGQGSALCGRYPGAGACNAKVCDAKLAANMEFFARFGIPDGSMPEWSPFMTASEKSDLPEAKPHGWIVIGG